MQEREKFGSRLGFILVSAGCAIGLGNVWRFPYIVGKYGGAAFILLYLIFLIGLGIPIMTMEFAVGRGSQKSIAASFKELEPKGTIFHRYSYVGMAGNYLLMMFYTMVCGWMLNYFAKLASGGLTGLTPDEVGGAFGGMLGSWQTLTFWMVVAVVIGFAICAGGLQKGVERITKWMMTALLVLMVVMAIRAVTLPGAGEGMAFYLKPNFEHLFSNFGEVAFAALGQSFFTLSIGIGSMAIFGSYLSKDRSLTGEAISITALDTFVALMAGLIIIPSCFAFGVDPGAGPGLVFVTLPNVFNMMPAGQLWGSLFFLFMSFAALSTVVAVFENIIAFWMDLGGYSRGKAVAINFVLIIVLSMPCVLGFNAWAGIQPFGEGSGIMDLEDFIVSNNLLPLGSMVYVFFCTHKFGWRWENFLAEANAGQGTKFFYPKAYMAYCVPAVVLIVYLKGYWDFFAGFGIDSRIGLGIALCVLAVMAYFIFYHKKDTVPNQLPVQN